MLVFELIKNKLINIRKAIKPVYAGKTPSLILITKLFQFKELITNDALNLSCILGLF